MAAISARGILFEIFLRTTMTHKHSKPDREFDAVDLSELLDIVPHFLQRAMATALEPQYAADLSYCDLDADSR